MIVVLIAVIVTVFSVPAYKKAQDKNRFMAASGVLIDLGNAIRMFSADYPDASAVAGDVTANATNSSATAPANNTNNQFTGWLQSNNYLNQIPFTSGTYMGYSFKFSTSGTAKCGSCAAEGVACMSGANLNSEYTCAFVTKQGQLKTL